MSRHQSLVATSAQVFCRLQMVAPDVASSISCRDINLMNSNFQLMVPDVATSIPYRDISSYLCSFQLMSSFVSTSILCHDISSCLYRFHWLLLVSRHQSSVATTAEVIAVSSFQTCHSFTTLFLSQHHDVVVTSFL